MKRSHTRALIRAGIILYIGLCNEFRLKIHIYNSWFKSYVTRKSEKFSNSCIKIYKCYQNKCNIVCRIYPLGQSRVNLNEFTSPAIKLCDCLHLISVYLHFTITQFGSNASMWRPIYTFCLFSPSQMNLYNARLVF